MIAATADPTLTGTIYASNARLLLVSRGELATTTP